MNPPPASATTEGDRDVTSSTSLAVIRTRLAVERTQLAWVRTSVTFITAGIAIDKVTEALHRSRVIEGTNWVRGSHWTGLILVIGSSLILALAGAGHFPGAHELPPCRGTKPQTSPAILAPTVLVLTVGALLTARVITSG